MHNFRRAISGATGVALLISLSACSGFRSANPVVNESGPEALFPEDAFSGLSSVNRIAKFSSRQNAQQPTLLGNFIDSYIDAGAVEIKVQDQIKYDTNSPNSAVNVSIELLERRKRLSYNLAVNGYNLVEYYCNSFFQNGGDNQKWLGFAKDIVAVLGSLGTGVSAIVGAGGDTTKILALTTATAYSGIDIYTRNFLFGADNISAVHNLVDKALAAHRKETVGALNASAAEWTMGNAMLQIYSHQMICQPAKIRELVLSAIKGGTVKAADATESNPPASNQTQTTTPPPGNTGGQGQTYQGTISPMTQGTISPTTQGTINPTTQGTINPTTKKLMSVLGQ